MTKPQIQTLVCCICGWKQTYRLKKKSDAEAKKSWRLSKSCEGHFESCFGHKAEGRTGHICSSCRKRVNNHKNNNELVYPHVVDSKSPTATSLDHETSHSQSTENSFTSPLVLEDISNTLNTTSQTPVVDSKSPTATSLDHEISHSQSTEHSFTPPLVLEDISNTLNTTSQTPVQPEHVHADDVTSSPPRPNNSPLPINPPSSPRKRNRDAIEVVSLPRNTRHRSDGQSVANLHRPASTHFFGYVLPSNVVANIMRYLPTKDVVNLVHTLSLIIQDMQSRTNETEKAAERITEEVTANMEQKLMKFVDVPVCGPLTQPQTTMLQKLILNRENNLDKDGCVHIKGKNGKGKRFLKVPKIQVGSDDAAKRTKNQRSQFIEKVEQILSTPQLASSTTSDLHSQRVNNIKRDLPGYAAAAEDAGLKVVTKFDRKTVLELRSIMTLRMWRVLKRVFTMEVGWDVFGSVEELQSELKEIEFKYECGTVKSSTGELVHFVRVSDIKEVVTQIVSDLYKSDELVYLNNLDVNSLWIHIAADKGGKTTKLILQIINQKSRHSIDFAKLIGYFDGKDDRNNLELVFGPVLKDLQKCVAEIASLKLPRPVKKPEGSVCKQPSKCDGE